MKPDPFDSPNDDPVGAELAEMKWTATLQCVKAGRATQRKPVELKTVVSGTTRRQVNFGWLWLAACVLGAACFFGRAAMNSSAAPSAANTIAAASTLPATKSIERIQVGDRVAVADNPAEEFDDSLGEVDPATWRRIELRPHASSSVVLIRPQAWLDERINQIPNRMFISVPEVGIHSDAEVISITNCPRIKPGSGRIVLSTFCHWADETIELSLNGITEPIRCTPQHSTWSHDRQEFVEAQHLAVGEHVLGSNGPIPVARIVRIPEPIQVYNLEVEGQHVYQVSAAGVLVHNSGPAGCAPQVTGKTGSGLISKK
jgi:pretoxin HINT domain-containing protein